MSVESTIETTTEAIEKALAEHQLSDAEKEEISRIVARALVKTVKKTTHNQVDTALNCCGPEQDLAHQLSEEMHRKKNLLISNLMALR
jgi:chaperonin cofactor prefoldin